MAKHKTKKEIEKKPRIRDVEEIKAENPVKSLLTSYGVKIRGSRYMPFCHSSDAYSGTVSDQSCYCFVCNKSFDCFTIVEHFEGITDFIDQALFLGGEDTTDENSPERLAAKERARKRKEEAERKEAEKKAWSEALKQSTDKIHFLRKFLRENKPAPGEWPSDEWVEAYNMLQQTDYNVACMLGVENSGGDISYLEEACF